MNKILSCAIFCLFACLVTLSCSRGHNNPVEPPDPGLQNIQSVNDSGRVLLGAFTITIDPVLSTASVVENRTLAFHYKPTIGASGNVLLTVDFDEEKIDIVKEGFDPYFRTWDLDIDLKNQTAFQAYDVRGIVDLDSTVIALHNADYKTTLWDGAVSPQWNPCKYHGDLGPGLNNTEPYYVQWAPVERPPLDCQAGSHPDYPVLDPGVKPDVLYFTYIVDASINAQCQEPYKIENFYQGPLEVVPVSSCTVRIDVYDHQNDIQYVRMIIPGPFCIVTFTPPPIGQHTWTGLLLCLGTQHPGVFRGQIYAKSTQPAIPDPYSNPNLIVKDVQIEVGDFNNILNIAFATPTQNDKSAVLADWQSRLSKYIAGEEIYGHYNEANGEQHFLIKQSITGESGGQSVIGKQYGGVRIPPGNKPANGWPVLVYCHFGDFVKVDQDTQCGIPDIYPNGSNWADKFALVMPSYRGNAVCWCHPTEPGVTPSITGTYQSDFENSLADWDADDVITFLENVINDTTNFGGLIDPNRVAIMGGSRGGSPAYLAALRDPYDKFDGCLIMCGSVTDLLSTTYPLNGYLHESCNNFVDYGYVPEDIDVYFNETYNLFDRFMRPLLAGATTGWQGHYDILKSSPIYFASSLPMLQVHQGDIDTLVNPLQAHALQGLGLPNQEFNYYPGVGHLIDKNNTNYRTRVDAFFDIICQ